MKISFHAVRAFLAAACLSGTVYAQQTADLAFESSSSDSIDQLGSEVISTSFRNCDSGLSSCCDSGSSCGFGSQGCDSLGCGCAPWTLLDIKNCYGLKFGGWTQVGYHSRRNAIASRLATNGVPGNFNDYDRVQLQQQWFHAGRVADGSNGLDWGGRLDYVYGTDGQDVQSFGNANGVWDNTWDNGGFYGHALPQAYGELAYCNFSMKIGHFFGLGGAEYVPAVNNFFYSRQFNYFNSRPLTLTGALLTTKLDNCTELFHGYAMGWDSGFQDNGDLYISGFNRQLDDTTSLTFVSNLGRFDQRRNERGQMYSAVLSKQLSCKMTSITQLDYLYTTVTNQNGSFNGRNTFAMIQYFIYELDRCWSVGSRTEWYNYSSGINGIRNADLYNQTLGLNYRPNGNLLLRPEIRQIWDINGAGGPVGVNEGGAASQMVFGTDMILTY